MFTKRVLGLTVAVVMMTVTALTTADEFSIDWYTVDNGGGYSAGGAFELDGTIGQPDAGFMIGDEFELDGGFWTSSQTCRCLGDVNGDGVKNGQDIQAFTTCLVAGGNCPCADVDGIDGVALDDVAVFVADLLSGSSCP
ncbi:MAG: hypothetical protein H6819_09600 [Phycisphaerales bacterium]|nr:hypothetical protein [Phycisphaerales bacterium]MCB9855479.1 hypothetical protein [Phycisphaerales bacterium]MCB9864256.1 hypothetical protein [Phycisphaerales bacterium]